MFQSPPTSHESEATIQSSSSMHQLGINGSTTGAATSPTGRGPFSASGSTDPGARYSRSSRIVFFNLPGDEL